MILAKLISVPFVCLFPLHFVAEVITTSAAIISGILAGFSADSWATVRDAATVGSRLFLFSFHGADS